jgi:hypothetical protein
MRALEDFLTANKLALPPDQDELRAAAATAVAHRRGAPTAAASGR